MFITFFYDNKLVDFTNSVFISNIIEDWGKIIFSLKNFIDFILKDVAFIQNQDNVNYQNIILDSNNIMSLIN